jgi:glutamate synthase domain-containing protein 1
LYNPRHEHDSCSVGFVANIKGHKSHGLIRQGLRILENLAHRNAIGADPLAGDGARILVQMPDRFLREECATQGISLPSVGEYGVGMLFLPQGTDARANCEDLISHYIKAEGQSLLEWRDVPTDNTGLGESVKAVEPVIRQVFIDCSESNPAGNAFERKLFVIRKQIAHNGEINTLRGNINWIAARCHSITSELLGDDLKKLWPLIAEEQSDSACFDNVLELLIAGGYPLAHAMMLLIPEAWAGNPLMDEKRRAFYEYHAALMEPWDGPAAVAFTDGRMIGAILDRNGLCPARYLE